MSGSSATHPTLPQQYAVGLLASNLNPPASRIWTIQTSRPSDPVHHSFGSVPITRACAPVENISLSAPTSCASSTEYNRNRNERNSSLGTTSAMAISATDRNLNVPWGPVALQRKGRMLVPGRHAALGTINVDAHAVGSLVSWTRERDAHIRRLAPRETLHLSSTLDVSGRLAPEPALRCDCEGADAESARAVHSRDSRYRGSLYHERAAVQR